MLGSEPRIRLKVELKKQMAKTSRVGDRARKGAVRKFKGVRRETTAK